jgi:hypothetical protein
MAIWATHLFSKQEEGQSHICPSSGGCMDILEIQAKLNQLTDFQAHRDLIDADKRALLEEVKIPAEVEAVIASGMKQITEIEKSFEPKRQEVDLEVNTQLEKIVVPEEVKTILAEIDRQRALANAYRTAKQAEITERVQAKIAEIQANTKDVYAAIAQRKAEIEAEFSGKREAVDENIAKLEKEIKEAVKLIGYTVESEHYQAVYSKPKKSWIPQRLEKYTETHPDIVECYTLGDPSVALRRK